MQVRQIFILKEKNLVAVPFATTRTMQQECDFFVEYGCFAIQIVFLLLTFTSRGHAYLVCHERIFKNYMLVETVVQVFCIIANLFLCFVSKENMVYLVALQVIVAGAIGCCFDIVAKKAYFRDLEEKIKEEKISTWSAMEIRRYMLEKHGFAVSVKDIEKCLSKINK